MNTEKLTEKVAEALAAGEALQCTRDWSGWFYDTMSDDDFVDASDGPLAGEIVEAILPMIQEVFNDAWNRGYNNGYENGKEKVHG